MTAVADIQARIAARVPALAGRVGGAAELSRLIADGGLPQHGTSAMVVPNGLAPVGQGEPLVGLFRQSILDLVAVVLTYRAAQREADATTDLAAMVRAVIEALVGWQPAGATGVVYLQRGRFLGAERGTIVYQIDFAFPDQLRVNPA
jgi:hypothetical protein